MPLVQQLFDCLNEREYDYELLKDFIDWLWVNFLLCLWPISDQFIRWLGMVPIPT